MTEVLVAAAIIVALGIYAWMSAALGSVFAKLGIDRGGAWVPIARYVAAARAADLSTAAVWTARLLATAGWATFIAAVAVRAADAANASESLVAVAALGFALGLAGSVVAWVLWVFAANRIELRLVLVRRLAWVAAVMPPLWATIVGRDPSSRPVPAEGAVAVSGETVEEQDDDATRAIQRVTPEQVRPQYEEQPPAAESDQPPARVPQGAGKTPMTTEEFDITGEYPRAFSPYDRLQAPPVRAPFAEAAPPQAGGAAGALPWEYDEDDATLFAKRRLARWILRVTDGDEYALEDVTTIGREGIRPIPGVLSIQDDTRTMSKLHARLRRESDNWFITDLGSTNGTFVRDSAGAELEVKAQTEAKVNGTLLLGDLEAVIVDQRGEN